jgi:replication initiation and membrane attachment protein
MSNNYPWKVIDPKDYIQIEAVESLTLKDVHALAKLYQPLIGAAAHSLYLTLFADLDFGARVKGATISELLAKLDMGIPDFYQARVRLEGIGLLRVYRNREEEGDYFYEIIPPLSAEAFFKDSLLRTLLVEKIGERLFREEMAQLLAQAKDKGDYEETTRSFLDVYHFDVEKNMEEMNKTDFMPFDTPKRPQLAETIEQVDTFDYDFFKKSLDKHFVNRESLTGEIKELIYTYHVVYDIDELTMQSLILESADVETGQVNKNKFTKYVQDNFAHQQKATGTKTKATAESVPASAEVTAEDYSSNERAIINHAKKTAPANYLQSIKDQKNGFVTTNEQWVLKELVEQSPLSKEVINMLLNYILIMKESVTLDKNYAMKIANDWAQSGVRSAEDALEKLREIYSKSPKQKQAQKQSQSYQKKSRYQNNRRDEKLPDWAQGEKKDTEQDDQRVSAEEADSLQNRLERLRKLRQEKEDN